MQNRALSTCGQRPVLLCYTLFDKFARGQRASASPARRTSPSRQRRHPISSQTSCNIRGRAQRTSPLHVTESGLAAIKKAFYMLEERRAYIKQLSHTRFTAGMAPFVIYLKNTITL